MPIENISTGVEEKPIPLSSRVTHKFYEPIILLRCLIGICKETATGSPPEPPIDINDDKQVFQAFVNKLGHVCDRLKGGNTVTSFTILHGNKQEKVHYWFAVNNQTRHELESAAAFVQELLLKVNQMTEDLEHQSMTRKDLLRIILLFNRPKVIVYLRTLQTEVEECVKRCQVDKGDDNSLLISELSLFINSDNNELSPNETEFDYIRRCEKTIHALIRLIQSRPGEIITQRALSGRMPGMKSIECWSDLLHTAKRILAYPQSVQFILLAYQRWPELFDNTRICFLSSSSSTRAPIRNKSLTAESIVGRMTRKEKQIEIFRQYTRTLQVFDLDKRIHNEYHKNSFSPIVHSEVLLLDWLENHDGTTPSRFFNDWAYIGSSKPTCKLCNYFFQDHVSAVEHRQSHGNLYPSWRLPDVFPSQGPTALEMREVMLNKILQRVRSDAFDMVRKKVPPSCKAHDSNTFSATVTLDMHWTMEQPARESDDAASLLGNMALSDQDASGVESDDVGGVHA